VFARTLLAGRAHAAARGALVTGAVVLGALNAANPAALIARVNLERQSARSVDVVHLAQLGGNAVPEILERFARLGPADRCYLEEQLAKRWGGAPEGDWRGWNVARSRAREAVRAMGRTAGCTQATTGSAEGTQSASASQ
jgi:hypothetical protein